MRFASKEEELRVYYKTLFGTWGRQHWWPARTRFEVIVGAYLTQNTAWRNVEQALRRLRSAGLLNPDGIRRTSAPRLHSLIRSAGYFRQKTRRLKALVKFLDEHYGGSLNRMFSQPTERLRSELLALDGVGPETADSILLYSGQQPVFVVDAYTRRILERHRIVAANGPYEEIRLLFERALAEVPWEQFAHRTPKKGARASVAKNRKLKGGAHSPSPMSRAKRSPLAQAYNEMHGLIMNVGKNYCFKSMPKCDGCPLQKFLPGAK